MAYRLYKLYYVTFTAIQKSHLEFLKLSTILVLFVGVCLWYLVMMRSCPDVFCSSRSRLSVLADSDEESSSAGSSDEEEVSSADTQGNLTEKAVPGVEG